MSVSEREIRKVMQALGSRGGKADSEAQANARRKNAEKARKARADKRKK